MRQNPHISVRETYWKSPSGYNQRRVYLELADSRPLSTGMCSIALRYLLVKEIVGLLICSVQNITILITKESSSVLFLYLSTTFFKRFLEKLDNEIDFVQNLITFCLWKTQYLTTLHRHWLTSRQISPA